MTDGPAGPPSADAVEMFGAALPQACAFADRLATVGIERGLLGPREVPVLWSRHLVNSALIAGLVPNAASVVDVGSGAGLPGIPLALARPDVRVVLLEPLLRRSTFLNETIDELGLADRVSVVRGRAGAPDSVKIVGGGTDIVTARAVAPLEKLVAWCAPLLAEHGTLLALKGERAADEVAASTVAIRRARLEVSEIVPVGDEGSHVVVLRRVSAVSRRQRTPGDGGST